MPRTLVARSWDRAGKALILAMLVLVVAFGGVVVVELRDGRIAFWREYQQKGPVSFDRFLDKNEGGMEVDH